MSCIHVFSYDHILYACAVVAKFTGKQPPPSHPACATLIPRQPVF